MTPDLTADMHPDDREALREVLESGRLRRTFNEAIEPCRPRVWSTKYPRGFIDSPADYSWTCPVHGPRWVEPVKPYNNAIESWATLAEAVDDARRHVEEKALTVRKC